MPTRLPLGSLLVPVRQIGARLTTVKLSRYSCALVLLPAVPTPHDWDTLPFGALVRDVYLRKARKSGDSVQLKVGAHAETVLVAICVAEQASTFERLQTAGRLARTALECEPQSVVIINQGCAKTAADAAVHAILAALEAAVFRFASFKSTPKAALPLTRIDVAMAEKVADLDLTLATTAGNNLARWLTALPPNILNAGNYRLLLQDFAAQLDLGFKFYGEAQLKRLGAGAFLAVSQGNASRDAGIVRLSYRPGAAGAATPPALSLVGWRSLRTAPDRWRTNPRM